MLPAPTRRQVVVGMLTAAGAPAAAADWPQQTIRLIVPFSPGGVPDIVARLVAEPMRLALGRPVLVENKPGAAGAVAAEAVAHAVPDGYTLFVTTMATQAIGPALHGPGVLRYDPERDFTPVSLLAQVPQVLLVTPGLPATDLKGLIALLQREPGRHAYGSPGIGGVQHLAAELLRQRAGVEVTHVPYRGSVPALTDLAAGRISFLFDALPPALPFIRDGRLRALGVGALAPSPAAPDIPPLSGAGLPGFEASSFAALYGPAGLPGSVVRQLHAAAVAALRDSVVAERLRGLAYDVVASSPEELLVVQRAETARWSDVIRQAGIRPESG
jgi:tripartite-type tricarboxylate transporter receptor subunit TctC